MTSGQSMQGAGSRIEKSLMLYLVRVVVNDPYYVSVFPEISAFAEKRREESLDTGGDIGRTSSLVEINVQPAHNCHYSNRTLGNHGARWVSWGRPD